MLNDACNVGLGKVFVYFDDMIVFGDRVVVAERTAHHSLAINGNPLCGPSHGDEIPLSIFRDLAKIAR